MEGARDGAEGRPASLRAADTAAFAGSNPPTYETRFYHLDQLGLVRMITNEARAIVATHDYGPFGEDTQPLNGDPRRYTGIRLRSVCL